MLLLRERSDHGYDLVSRLRELHVVDGDAGAVYRALRGLERNGLVRSSWQTSDAGPARRTYQVTSAGVADLNRQAVLLEATHQTLHVFRGRYQRLAGGAIVAGADLGCPDRGEENGHVHGELAGEVHSEPRHGHGEPDDRGVHPAIGAGERAGG
ncbi:MAG TPA: helix-turn-helix transcriptional regulator [Pseudonocardia sp.]|nr:helix-turn-helix transcriptional regulator [Pseudonocardia sp.]